VKISKWVLCVLSVSFLAAAAFTWGSVSWNNGGVLKMGLSRPLLHPQAPGGLEKSPKEIVPMVVDGVARELLFTRKLTVRSSFQQGLPRYQSVVDSYLSHDEYDGETKKDLSFVTAPLISSMKDAKLGKGEQVDLLNQMGRYFYSQAMIRKVEPAAGRLMKVRLLRLAILHLEEAKKI
jgi:hypothetical protein